MRLMPAALALLALTGSARCEQLPFPIFDIAKTCRAQADYVFAATLGQADLTIEIAACQTREDESKARAETLWPLVSRKDATECRELADDKYGYLARCLADGQSLRTAR